MIYHEMKFRINEANNSKRRLIKWKFVIQRVTEASCTVDGNVTGTNSKGFLVLIGIADTDTTAIADKMIKKLLGLRIFEDADGKQIYRWRTSAEVFC